MSLCADGVEGLDDNIILLRPLTFGLALILWVAGSVEVHWS